jgi:hypothetical protein
MREHLIVSSIRSRQIVQAQRSGVRHGEDALKALDLGNSLLSVHPSQYPTERLEGQLRSGISKDRDC